jgi:hypothetical protein
VPDAGFKALQNISDAKVERKNQNVDSQIQESSEERKDEE